MSARHEHYHLEAEVSQRLSHLLLPLRYPTGEDFEQFLAETQRAMRAELPMALVDRLERLSTEADPPGFILIEGLPIDPLLPATPADGRRPPDKLTSISEATLLGIASLLGQPYSYRVEKGTLVHDVCPTARSMHALTNEGSMSALGYHTELAYFATPPRRLLIQGLRQDHDQVARTPVADVRDALERLDDETHIELRPPQFTSDIPHIFHPHVPHQLRRSDPHPVLTGTADRPSLRAALYGNLTRARTEQGAHALQKLDQAFHEVRHQLTLTPGSLLILDNCLVAHSRSRFTPGFDGRDRWLQRVHVADSLWRLRHLQTRSQRLLDTPGTNGHRAGGLESSPCVGD
jgi:L-asparagine oxygenase